jgi:catechol 2,3-dioxygenase-like lactoylglutathione lyase family enzyme
MSDAMTTDATEKPKPALNLRFISHGTLETLDLDRARQFYENFLGFETVQASKMSLWVRLGGAHIYVVVKAQKKEKMPFLNHNGIDVATDAEVDEAHRITVSEAEKWGLHAITKPALQHGTYSFYFYDADDNCWEILSNPKDGYSWMFDRGDQDGLGHLKRSFERPLLDE